MTFTISTWADSRSNRRDRTYVVQAATAVEALNQATELACRSLNQWTRSVFAKVTDVDGKGPPLDCPHPKARELEGFTYRADGGRVCRECHRLLVQRAVVRTTTVDRQ